MPGPVHIEVIDRPAADVDDVGPLWRSMVDHHRELAGGDHPVRDAVDSWAICRADYGRWLADGSGVLLVAKDGGTAVGYAFLRLLPSGQTFDFGDVRGEVDALAVAPAARGSGVGTALLERARAELRERGCRYWTIGVMEANLGAAALYERMGFRPWLRELAAPLDR